MRFQLFVPYVHVNSVFFKVRKRFFSIANAYCNGYNEHIDSVRVYEASVRYIYFYLCSISQTKTKQLLYIVYKSLCLCIQPPFLFLSFQIFS